MTNHSNSLHRLPGIHQSGAALITGLIFMVVLTMIGVTAARMSTLEERMSGNMRDRSIAMQAAELALRDAERDIRNQFAPGAATSPDPRRSPPISGVTGFAATCNLDATASTYDDGLCDRRGAAPTYTSTSVTFPTFTASGTTFAAMTLDLTGAPSVSYGRYTGAASIAGLTVMPRYIIEAVPKYISGETGEVFFYRITVRAQGANPNTAVWLQEVFRP